MKVFISADIEGVAGIAHWDEAEHTNGDYGQFRQQMQREVNAACEGAFAAGASVVRIKDAHATGRNLVHAELPSRTEIVREWSGHPFAMVQELDDSFHALVLVGYHSGAGSGGNPLSHTLTGATTEIRLNGQPAAEMHLFALTAASIGVPTVFVSGDLRLCQAAHDLDTAIVTVATTAGRGRSVLARHPDEVVDDIRAGVTAALQGPSPPVRRSCVAVPDTVVVELDYKDHRRAYDRSFYPGARLVGDRTVALEVDAWFDVVRALHFLA